MSKIPLVAGLVFVIGLASTVGTAQVGDQGTTEGLTIRGTVMVSPSRQPVPGTRVQLRRREATGNKLVPYRVTTEKSVTTDDKGRFAFSGLAPGDYEVLPLAPEDPDRRLAALSRPRNVNLRTPGVPFPGLELWLTPISKISGRILDPDGKASRGFRVNLGRVVWDDGATLAAVPGAINATADDDGEYTLSAPPGEYYLVVSRPAGGLALGAEYYFYPGVAHVEDAIPFTVRPGVDLGGIDVALDRRQSFRAQFRLSLPEYLPDVPDPLVSYTDRLVSAQVVPLGRGRVRRGASSIALESLEKDAWLTQPLEPGDYEIAVHYSSALADALQKKKVQVQLRRWSPITTARITVDPREDIDSDHVVDVGTFHENPKISMRAHIVLERAEGSGIDLTKLGNFVFADTIFPEPVRVVPDADGGYITEGFHRGLFRLLPPTLPDGFYVASANAGTDVLNDGLRVDGAGGGPLVIVIRGDGSQIEGVVRDNSSPVADAHVILVPPRSRRGPMTRFPNAVANASGAYVLRGVPPGDYRLLALDVAGRPETHVLVNTAIPYWKAPEFLSEFESRGERITVAPRSRVVINPSAVTIYE
jgi:hypothetical protein